MSLYVSSSCLMLVLVCLGGCASTARHPLPRANTTPAVAGKSTPATARVGTDTTAFVTEGQESADLEKLALLWTKRTQEGAPSDYPIGPGDVVEISVPGMEELKDRTTVRVSGDGMIALPFVGTMQASGLTEAGLREEIRRRLEANYMYDPQVNVFVREYRSRQVAVVGAVGKPGLYNLASGADTLLDMVNLAGGVTQGAAPRIQFIPAEPVAEEDAKKLASALPIQLGSKDPSPLLLKRADPIVINLDKEDTQPYLALPARPGDVIMVPNAGQVLVSGWVDKPGPYGITPGLTVIGAVVAAGDSLFAADTSSVKVIRTGEKGEKTSFLANLDQIKRGEKPDVFLQGGDVIEVSYSSLKLVPYGVYSLFRNILRIGAIPLY